MLCVFFLSEYTITVNNCYLIKSTISMSSFKQLGKQLKRSCSDLFLCDGEENPQWCEAQEDFWFLLKASLCRSDPQREINGHVYIWVPHLLSVIPECGFSFFILIKKGRAIGYESPTQKDAIRLSLPMPWVLFFLPSVYVFECSLWIFQSARFPK